MSRPDDEELELSSARQRAEEDDLAGRKARLAVESAVAAHPLAELAVERERKPFVSEPELPIAASPSSQRVEHAVGVVQDARKRDAPVDKVMIAPQINRSKFATGLSQIKRKELGLTESKTAGGQTARLLVAPGVWNGSVRDEPLARDSDRLQASHSNGVGGSGELPMPSDVSSEKLTTATISSRALSSDGRPREKRIWPTVLVSLFIVATIVPTIYFIAYWEPSKLKGAVGANEPGRASQASEPAPMAPQGSAGPAERAGTVTSSAPVLTESPSSAPAAPSTSVSGSARPHASPTGEIYPDPPIQSSAVVPSHSAAAPSSLAPTSVPPVVKPSTSANPNIF